MLQNLDTLTVGLMIWGAVFLLVLIVAMVFESNPFSKSPAIKAAIISTIVTGLLAFTARGHSWLNLQP